MYMVDPRDQGMQQRGVEVNEQNPNIRYNVWTSLVSDRALLGPELIAECELAMKFIFPPEQIMAGEPRGGYV